MKQGFVILLLTISFFSCNLLEKDQGDDALARVYDKYLYAEDIEDLLQKMTGEKDSAVIITNYINNWIQQELLLEKAELNLNDDQKDFQKLLEDYRRSLIIYAFQKEYIRQKLDTIVSDEEISNYYEQNQANFELKENIVKVRYAQVAKNAPKINDLQNLIQKTDAESKAEFKEYCVQYAVNYSDNDSTWIPFDRIKMLIPIVEENDESFLKRNKFVNVQDSLNLYFLYIDEYKIKKAISPLSFEHDKIRNIIVNQRKLELMDKMKSNLFESAFQKGNAEIYTP